MKLLGRNKLQEFVNAHADAKKWISNWIVEVEEADWQTPSNVKTRYPSASILPNTVFVFNVKGNTYRLETKIDFKRKIVLVQWAGTHAEYDKRNKLR